MRIAVNAIAQDEAKNVPAWLAAAADADAICVLDCGSADDTPALLAADRRVTLARSYWKPFRFDHARNAGLATVPPDIDWVVVVDLDERLQPGWRAEIERAAAAHPTAAGLTVLVEHRAASADGKTGATLLASTRVHRRWACTWRYPAHVLPVIQGPIARTGAEIKHAQDARKDRRGRLALMQLGAREYPHDARPHYYLGRELYGYRRWREAGDVLDRYLSLGGFAPERSSAMRMISGCCGHLGDREGQLSWALRAAAEAPGYREAWCALASAHLARGERAAAAGAAQQALSITRRPQDWITEGAAWGDLPQRLLAASIAKGLS